MIGFRLGLVLGAPSTISLPHIVYVVCVCKFVLALGIYVVFQFIIGSALASRSEHAKRRRSFAPGARHHFSAATHRQ